MREKIEINDTWKTVHERYGELNEELVHYTGKENMKSRFFSRLQLANRLDIITKYKELGQRNEKRRAIADMIMESIKRNSKYYYLDMIDLIEGEFDIETQSWL